MTTPSYQDTPQAPTRYIGQNYRFAPVYTRNRDPKSGTDGTPFTCPELRPPENQGYYLVGSFWFNMTTFSLWVCVGYGVDANRETCTHWVLIEASHISGVEQFKLPDGSTITPTGVPPQITITNGPGISVTQGGDTHTIQISNAMTITGDTGGAVGIDPTGTIFDRGASTTYVTGTPGTHTIKAEVVSTANTILVGNGSTTASTPITAGNDGQVLIGATGNKPAFGTLTSSDGSITFTPGANTLDLKASFPNPGGVLQIFDDFLPGNAANHGDLDIWYTDFLFTDSTAGHPGIVQCANAAAQGICLTDAGLNNSFIPGGGQIELSWVFNLPALSNGINRYTVQIGFGDQGQNVTPNNGIFFSYSDNVNAGNWVLNTISGGVSTTQNTATAAATGFHTYKIVLNAAGTSVSFFIDGVQIGTAITTHIPTTGYQSMINLVRVLGALPLCQIDLFVLKQTLTTPR